MNRDSQSFEAQIGRIEKLVAQIEQSSDASAREAAREMVAALLDLHGAALGRMLAMGTKSNGGGRSLIEACLDDDLVRSLLLLHDLHPENLEDRVRQALDKVRPYLHSHGGDVVLLEVSSDRIRLRMEGSCDGCPSSSATLKNTIEQAIYEIAPDVAAIEVEDPEGAVPSSGLVQLDFSPQVSGVPHHDNGHVCSTTTASTQENS